MSVIVQSTSSAPHECNAYCRPAENVHACTFWVCEPMTDDWAAIIDSEGRRHDIVEWRLAPELPPVDPTAPEDGPYPYRYVVWSRRRER